MAVSLDGLSMVVGDTEGRLFLYDLPAEALVRIAKLPETCKVSACSLMVIGTSYAVRELNDLSQEAMACPLRPSQVWQRSCGASSLSTPPFLFRAWLHLSDDPLRMPWSVSGARRSKRSRWRVWVS